MTLACCAKPEKPADMRGLRGPASRGGQAGAGRAGLGGQPLLSDPRVDPEFPQPGGQSGGPRGMPAVGPAPAAPWCSQLVCLYLYCRQAGVDADEQQSHVRPEQIQRSSMKSVFEVGLNR